MNFQYDLFNEGFKTKNAEKHDRLRSKQNDYLDSHHHPQEKIQQLIKLDKYIHGDILELFAGQGNLSKHYEQKGKLYKCTKEITGDSFQHLFELINNKKTFDVIDIDSYGYPSQFMDNVWHVMKPKSLLILTFPVMGVQCINGIVEQHFINFWRSARPSTGDVVGAVTDYGLKYWYLPKLIDIVKIKPIWRYVFECERVKATEFCSTKNRK